ncbi:hypothetical protein EXIGLDRAFT_691430 [Exidia glandulosa HHB12029]|uniref:Protein kinase domain-containing protein n=1 Tax=Exidia glandulosa HHB12029 TaxID=1314781 RepID=A0A165IP07_EXIGL|nr:hypothetical protein EXIGLDRAFT_691430 [Exidia glandulosa HHB12029]
MSPLHSYLILFIGDNARDDRNSKYHTVILQRPRDLSNYNHDYKRISIFCVVQKWYPFGSYVPDSPLFKGCVFGGPFPTQDIVVKTAPAHDSKATRRLHREAKVYEALASLQGEVIPECLGYFTGDSDVADVDDYIPSAALVTLNYGDTLMNEYEKGQRSRDDLWEDMAGYYKYVHCVGPFIRVVTSAHAVLARRRIIGAVSEIHAKGFHLGHPVGTENIILDKWTDGDKSGMDPFVVGLSLYHFRTS